MSRLATAARVRDLAAALQRRRLWRWLRPILFSLACLLGGALVGLPVGLIDRIVAGWIGVWPALVALVAAAIAPLATLALFAARNRTFVLDLRRSTTARRSLCWSLAIFGGFVYAVWVLVALAVKG